jgi:membrane protease YdiL (CAAX protease family)
MNLAYFLIFLTFYFYKEIHCEPINSAKLTLLNGLRKGIVGVFVFIPLSSLVNYFWMTFLGTLQTLGLNLAVIDQPLIAILKEGQLDYWQLLGVFTLVGLGAPVVEELMFRYFFYRFCKCYMLQCWAKFFVALLFALLHTNLATFAGLFFMGIFLTNLYERHRNLYPCIIVHSAFNIYSVLLVLYTFADSPGS